MPGAAAPQNRSRRRAGRRGTWSCATRPASWWGAAPYTSRGTRMESTSLTTPGRASSAPMAAGVRWDECAVGAVLGAVSGAVSAAWWVLPPAPQGPLRWGVCLRQLVGELRQRARRQARGGVGCAVGAVRAPCPARSRPLGGCCILHLKGHSYGKYVSSYSWASCFSAHGGRRVEGCGWARGGRRLVGCWPLRYLTGHS